MDKPAPTDVPIHDLLSRRWSPRAFADRPVEPDKLRRLLEAARWAPSSYGAEPWAFVIATRDRPEDYTRVLGCLVEGNQAWAKAAPVLMITAARLNFEYNGQPNRHAFHDVGLAVANLTVQATAEGLFVHQMAGIVPAKAKVALGIPEGWEPVTGVAVGYPGDAESLPEPLREREKAPRKRKPVSEFTFAGGWGKAMG
jgi:nitroreductase